MDGGSIPDAKRAVDEARDLLQPLTLSDHVFVTHVSKRAIEQLPSQQEIADLAKTFHTPMPRDSSRIEPFVDCVGLLDSGLYEAVFGYSSEFSHPFQLSSSTGQNKFEPKPHERGQPNEFLPGSHHHVVSIVFDGEPITWFVRGMKAVASKDSRRCN
jgi:hypothetical protein